MAGIGSHTKQVRGATDTWLTPPEIIHSLGEFDLDPCCPPVMPWQTAKKMLHHPLQDGLTESWLGRVWLNPPYGDEVDMWCKKMAVHNRGTMLIFARTETNWWHDYIWQHATAVLFLRGRLHFHHVDGIRAKHNAGGPSALVAFGTEDALRMLAANNSKRMGKFLLMKGGA